MSRNRRIFEAAALRELFREQWARICELHGAQAARDDLETAAVDDAIEDIVDGTSAKVRAIGSYRKRLRASARAMLDHVTDVVARMPEPVPITRSAFTADARVNAFFVNPAAIEETCGSDRTLRDFFGGCSSPDRAYFSLFMSRTEREMLGIGSFGEMLVRDVRQTTVAFSGHRLIAPCLNEAEARTALRKHLFDSVVAYVRGQLVQRETARPRRGTRATATSMSPEAYLDRLAAVLGQPQALLRTEEDFLVISRLGVKLDECDQTQANALRVQEIAIGDRDARVAVLATYPRAEMCETDRRLAKARAALAVSANSVLPIGS
jgi:hypothetical protein